MDPAKSVLTKIFLFFNFIFCLFAFTLIILGAIVFTESIQLQKVNGTSSANDTGHDPIEEARKYESELTAFITIISVGVLGLLIGVLGWCGSAKDSRILLVLYALLVFCSMVVHFFYGTIVVLLWRDVDRQIESLFARILFELFVSRLMLWFGILTLSSAICQLMQVIFSCALVCTKRNNDDDDD